MTELRTIRRRIWLYLLSWQIHARSVERIYKVLAAIIAVLACCAGMLWRHFGTDASLPVLADMTPILLAIVGIIMSYIPPKKETHIVTSFVLIIVGLAGSAVLTVARLKTETAHRNEMGGLYKKIDAVGDQNSKLSDYLLAAKNTGMSETDRRKGILTTLRNQWILSHDPVDPDILAGTKMPPQDWIKKRLIEMGETWSVAEETPQTTAPRSYIVLDGNPKFTGPNAAGAEGSDFIAGSPIMFNIHFKNSGPNALEYEDQAMAAYLKDDYKPETQEALLAEFTNEVKREKQNFKGPMPDSSQALTMGPGSSEFFTATDWSSSLERVLFTQNDLDQLKSGTKIAFVIAEIRYKDAGIQHHFRMCMWLQPPATANGIWHYCNIFNASD